MPTTRSLWPIALAPLLLAASALSCDDAEPSTAVDVDEVVEEVGDYRETHAPANPTPMLGAHGTQMKVWLQPEHVDLYLSIIPSNRAELVFPEGTLFVKEHLDENLEPFEITVMYKGPTGYNPDYGDWWYGEVDVATGELIDGGPDLPSCVDCHASAWQSDWVHGLPEP